MEAIRTYDLTKYYGSVRALEGVNIGIREGEIFTILGPNGAGKTTFLLLLATILKPTRGTAIIKDLDIRRDDKRVREIVGIAFQNPQLYWRLTPYEILRFHASIYGIRGSERDRRLSLVMRRLGIEGFSRRMSALLSGGEAKRVEVAKVLIQRPEVAIFDEPTAMVDLEGKHVIWEEIKRLRDEGSTVIVATNEVYEAEVLSDRVAIIDRGRLIDVGTPRELKDKIPAGDLIEIKVQGKPDPRVGDMIKGSFNVTELVIGESYIILRMPESRKRLADLIKIVSEHGAKIESINIRELTLDDVFLYYTKRRIL
ncbi:MAG: ABC transporter ATP-binding protein [Fervidicoccaceae archaeon]